MFASRHDELLGALFVDTRHLDELFGGEFPEVVEARDALADQRVREVVVHAVEFKKALVGLAEVFFAGDRVGEDLVAGALAEFFDRFTVEGFDREEFLFLDLKFLIYF